MIFPDVFEDIQTVKICARMAAWRHENNWKYHRDSMHIQIFLPEKFSRSCEKFSATPGQFFWQKKIEYAWNRDDISRCFCGTRRPPLRMSWRSVCPRKHLEISSWLATLAHILTICMSSKAAGLAGLAVIVCTQMKCKAAFNRYLAFLSGQITVERGLEFHMRTRSNSFSTQNCHCVYAYEMHRRQFSDAFRSFFFSRRK